MIPSWCVNAILAACALMMLGGCASNGNVDPWEKTNRFFYNFDDGLDRVLLKPVSDAYVKVVPEPIRTGIGNGFSNLSYANVILNDFLQAKWRQGFSDAGRMAVNSTIGIAGFFDPASKWGLVAHDNDFGITLGKWGVKSGPYLVLPLLGPSSLRDVTGYGTLYVTDPLTWVSPPIYVTFPLYTVDVIDKRSRVESLLGFRNKVAIDPYIFVRDAYLQYRENQIHEGAKPVPQNIYDEDSDMGPSTAPSTAPAATSRSSVAGR